MQEVKYYGSFSGYHHPIKLTNKIDIERVKGKNYYLRAIYINNKLALVEKYINKNFLDMFIRTKNKRIKIEIMNINGEKNNIKQLCSCRFNKFQLSYLKIEDTP